MLKILALRVFLWTFFFCTATGIEEVSLMIWNGYALAGAGGQFMVLPIIFVLGMVVAVSVLPFFVKLPVRQRLPLVLLSLAFWATLLLVPMTRYLLTFMTAGLLYANW